ncbi:ABC transporter ATP-binding protein [Geminicoccus flavidas]|uniref:ABC transporter ATP-binding protein n=1 Tax=Geminicoccus flavidas TaxID=2506407 RepID=UPI002AB26DED|nr:ABC transporter ATP-binding protein [Geminicoccus flavidas]
MTTDGGARPRLAGTEQGTKVEVLPEAGQGTGPDQGLVIQDVWAGYRGRPVIQGLSLAPIPAGSVTSLVGPNGAGKSTLLRGLAGLLPARGSIRFAGQELGGLSFAARAKLATYMPQTLPAGTALSVLETVLGALHASPAGQTRPDEAGAAAGEESNAAAPERALAALQRLHVADLAMEPLDRLSGGQRQMVALAQAVVRGTGLLLLDEPTSALDLRHQVEVMAVVRALAAEGRTVLLVLHDLSLAGRWSDRIVVLDRGRLHADGMPVEVIRPDMLAQVYGVRARVERCSAGHLQVAVDGPLSQP